MIDPVIADLNNYLTSMDDTAAYDLWLEQRVIELTDKDGECYPYSHDNYAEALASLSPEQINIVAMRLEFMHDEAACEYSTILFNALVDQYWQDKAYQKAKDDFLSIERGEKEWP